MTKPQIIDLQTHLGVAPDGFWGPKSIAAAQRRLRALMPVPNPWPKSDQTSLTRFYGRPGDESRHTYIKPPFPMFIDGQPVAKIKVHERCADSLLRVLIRLLDAYPASADRVSAGLTVFDGVYNNRSMRGGTLPSLHARAAAIDLDAGRNRNQQHWPVSATMPFRAMEIFAAEGWLSAGAFWSRDAMHFQATQ